MNYENIETSSELPSYSPLTPLPDYSCELSSGETLLEHTPYQSQILRPSALYIKKEGATTVILNDQEEGVAVPRYGRQATISGSLCFEQSDNIVEVTVKIRGSMDIFASQGGAQSITVVDVSYPLWSQTPAELQSSTCPPQITFSHILPATFKAEDDRILSLPPSYNSPHLYLAGPFARVSYTLQLVIRRIRHPKVSIWLKTQQISIPFKYIPRTRAHRAIIPYSSFFTSVKIAPEEWYQAVAQLTTKDDKMRTEPLHCHLFLLGHRAYGLSDIIPFHVQLSGNVCALRELFPSVQRPERVRSSSASQRTTASDTSQPAEHPRLKVSLLRQVAACFRGSRSWEDSIISEGTIRPLPPRLADCCTSKDECMNSDGHVDWEGELRCKESITVGGFDAANIHVKDFIVLKLLPGTSKSSTLALQITVPIKLVTDSCDVAGLELTIPTTSL